MFQTTLPTSRIPSLLNISIISPLSVRLWLWLCHLLEGYVLSICGVILRKQLVEPVCYMYLFSYLSYLKTMLLFCSIGRSFFHQSIVDIRKGLESSSSFWSAAPQENRKELTEPVLFCQTTDRKIGKEREEVRNNGRESLSSPAFDNLISLQSVHLENAECGFQYNLLDNAIRCTCFARSH